MKTDMKGELKCHIMAVLISFMALFCLAAINGYEHFSATGGGDKNGSTWENAYPQDSLRKFLQNTVVAGDVIFLKGDIDYTADSIIDCTARDGSAVSPIAIIGVKAATTHEGADIVFADWARDTADMPHLNIGLYYTYLGDYYQVRNLNMRSAGENVLRNSTEGIIENCKIQQTGDAGAYYAVILASGGLLLNCDITSPNRYGVYVSSQSRVMYNYIHDCTNATYGIGMREIGTGIILFNKIKNCTIGINLNGQNQTTINGNTIFKCGTGIVSTGTEHGTVIINNLLDSCRTYGVNWNTQTDHNFYTHNHGDDTRCTDMWNNVDVSTLFKDNSVTTGDPLFTDTVDGFQLGAESPAFNTGQGVR